MRYFISVLLLCSTLFLAGCGQTGALYLPKDGGKQAQPANYKPNQTDSTQTMLNQDVLGEE